MRIKELTPKYAALATAIEARFGAKVERLPTSTGELVVQRARHRRFGSGTRAGLGPGLRRGVGLGLDHSHSSAPLRHS